MSFQPVGDSVTIARLAYDLYSKGFLVARHAPEDFRVLLKELKIIKNLLGLVQAKLRNNDDLFDNYAGEVLQHCREALLEFKPLVIKYEMLADTNRGLWIRRFQWATDQHRIKSCREKFSYYQSYLQLVLIPGTKQERARILDQNALQIDSNREGAPGTEAHEGERASGHPGASSPRRTSIDLIGTELGSRAQEDPDEPVPASQLDVRRWLRDLLWFPAPVDVPPVDDPQLESEGLDTLGSLSAKLNPNREKHDASSYIRNQFLKALEDIETETDVEALLRLATWWLLKSRVVQDALKSVEAEDAEQRTNNHQAPWSSNINAMQSYIDLLKASFIVEDVVLTESRSSETLIDATWIMLKNLSDSIHRDLAEWRSERSVPSIPNDNRISDFDLSFFETFLQPMENPRRLPVALDNLQNPHRWLTPDLDHAGQSAEICLFRTFVNAQIGHKNARMKSLSAPYMLVIFCEEGKAELVVSLLNQHKTINLCRCMTEDDLKVQREDTQPWEGFKFDFPSQDCVIQFLSMEDKKRFIEYHRTYFSEMSNRTPRQLEFLTFRDSLRSYNLRDPSPTPSIAFPRHTTHTSMACEVSLFGLIPGESWKATRRIVISSSPAAQKRWSMSHWLPLDAVEVQENGRQVSIIWSDCDHLDKRSDGFYIRHYSYVYKPHEPNRVLELEFKTLAAAEAFVNCILRPLKTPFTTAYVKPPEKFVSICKSQAYQIYQLSDMHEAGSLVYRALEIVTARPHSNFVTNVHFIYRDFDFDLHTQKSSVKFLNLQAQTYISNKTDLNVEPADDAEPPELEGVKAIARSSKFVFDNANDRIQFMKMLLGWDLIFLRPIRTVQLKGRAHVRSKKIEKATVALWKKQTTDDDLNTTHLALTIRCNDSSPDSGPRWTTAALDMNHSIKEDYKSSRISISNLKIRQGAEIDSDTMGAVRRSGGHPVEPHQRWTIILPLDARLDIEEFAKQIKPVLDNWPGED